MLIDTGITLAVLFLKIKQENFCATRREISLNVKLTQNLFLVFDKKFRLSLLYPANINSSDDSRVVVCVRVGELAVLEFCGIVDKFSCWSS